MEVKNKIALVTGANRGIGKAIVDALLEAGIAKVYAGARDTSSVDVSDDRVVPIKLDVTNDADITAAAKEASDVDILVNNAGVLVPGNFSSGNLIESLDQNMIVNVYGVAKVTSVFLPKLQEKNEASLVILSSVVGLAPMTAGVTYSMSKAAVHSMIAGLRAELKETNVSVTGVYPGPIDTDMAKGFEIDKESPENVGKEIVAGIEAGAEDVFPDPMSKQVGEGYASNPKAIEKQFGGFS